MNVIISVRSFVIIDAVANGSISGLAFNAILIPTLLNNPTSVKESPTLIHSSIAIPLEEANFFSFMTFSSDVQRYSDSPI